MTGASPGWMQRYVPTPAEWNEAFEAAAAYAISQRPPQTNANWNATDGPSVILNKPNLSVVALSGSYLDLSDRPQIPSKVSDVTNDAGYQTASDVSAAITASEFGQIAINADNNFLVIATAFANMAARYLSLGVQ